MTDTDDRTHRLYERIAELKAEVERLQAIIDSFERVGYRIAPDGRTIWNGSAPMSRDEWLYRKTPTEGS